MKKKFTKVLAFLFICLPTISYSADPPAVPSTLYDNGPLSPFLEINNISESEAAAYVLIEAIMQIAEAKIHASECAAAESISKVSIFTDGSHANSSRNFVEVTSLGGVLRLVADIQPPVEKRGQKINIKQNGIGLIAGTRVASYLGTASFNFPSRNLLTGAAKIQILDEEGEAINYSGQLIKDFSRAALQPFKFSPNVGFAFNPDYYIILDWGLQALYKKGFPENKYWQRSKSKRNNGINGRTVHVKDQLVGADEACRITVSTKGINNADFFWQEGEIAIEVVPPSAPVPEFALF